MIRPPDGPAGPGAAEGPNGPGAAERHGGDRSDAAHDAPDLSDGAAAHGARTRQAGWLETPDAPIELRPSLLAAFDVAAKLAFLVLAAALPLLIGLAFSGDLRVFLAGIVAAVLGGTTGLVYAGIAAFAPLVQLAFTRYIIEPDGIRVRTQILSKTERRVQWEKITMLHHRRSVVDRVFGLDRLDVIAYGARGTTLHLVGLRGAAGLRDLVARRMREHAAVGGRFGDD